MISYFATSAGFLDVEGVQSRLDTINKSYFRSRLVVSYMGANTWSVFRKERVDRESSKEHNIYNATEVVQVWLASKRTLEIRDCFPGAVGTYVAQVFQHNLAAAFRGNVSDEVAKAKRLPQVHSVRAFGPWYLSLHDDPEDPDGEESEVAVENRARSHAFMAPHLESFLALLDKYPVAMQEIVHQRCLSHEDCLNDAELSQACWVNTPEEKLK